MVKLPKKVRVACFDIAIKTYERRDAHNDHLFGIFSGNGLYIKVDTDQPPIKVVDTLLHEINHAIFWAYGVDDEDKEERLVGTFATAWTQVYRDNPALLKFIQRSL